MSFVIFVEQLCTLFYLLEFTHAKVIRLNMMFNNKGLSAINTIPNHEQQMVQKIIKSKLFIFSCQTHMSNCSSFQVFIY